MMIKRLGAVALTLLILSMPAQAWNGKGHMTVAHIAYTNLDPAVRQRVDTLLESHPDFARLREFAGAPNSPNYRLIIFMNASTWPDSIRNDSRFLRRDRFRIITDPKDQRLSEHEAIHALALY